ncbi:hypothetical protein KEM52_004076, partial [Ascosphaera acerosa]
SCLNNKFGRLTLLEGAQLEAAIFREHVKRRRDELQVPKGELKRIQKTAESVSFCKGEDNKCEPLMAGYGDVLMELRLYRVANNGSTFDGEDRHTWSTFCGMIRAQEPPADSKSCRFSWQQSMSLDFSPLSESVVGYRPFTELSSRVDWDAFHKGNREERKELVLEWRKKAAKEVGRAFNQLWEQEKRDYEDQSVCLHLERTWEKTKDGDESFDLNQLLRSAKMHFR